MQNATKLLWIALCALILAACSSSSDDDDVENSVPVVDAIADQTVDSGGTVVITLTGSDGDEDPLTFTVDPTDGATIDGDTLTIVAPVVTEDTVLTFNVVANDGTADSSAEVFTVTVNAPNQAPVLDPVADDLTVESEGTLELTLTGTDADEEPLTFAVEQTAGTDATVDVVADTGVVTITAPAVTEDEVLSFSATASDGIDDSAAVAFDVTVTAPVVVVPPPAGPIFDGSVDSDAASIEMVAVVPSAEGFTAYYSQAIDANGGTGGDDSASVFEQQFLANGAPVAGTQVDGLLDIGPETADGGAVGFAPDILIAAEAVVTPDGTLFRPLQEQDGTFFNDNGAVAFTEYNLAIGQIDGTVALEDLPTFFESTVPFTVTIGPVEQTFSAIGDDMMLALNFRLQQEFGAAVDADGGINDGTGFGGVADGVIDETDVDSAALGNVGATNNGDPTDEVLAFIVNSDGSVEQTFDIFAGEIFDVFDPVDPPNGEAFASVFTGGIQGAAFGDGGATGGFAAFVNDLTNTLRMNVVTADGTILPVETLDDTLPNGEDNVAVATLSTGQVMVAWTTVSNPSDPFNPIDFANETIVVGQVVNADGSFATDVFQIGGDNIFDPRIVALADGRAAVSWFGGDDGLAFAAQIIDPADAANNSVVYVMPGAREDGTENGAAGAELADGNVVLSINDDDFVILVEGVGFLTNPQ